jgi:hypothetical protein
MNLKIVMSKTLAASISLVWGFDNRVINMKVVHFRLYFSPENIGNRKIKLFYGELMATLHSLPGRWP